ncbi:MAG: hypothetical protein L6R43_14395 [Planctomycetes bacterium]|nr:hypothetical protein [Planctomycetota bacterium]
MRVPHAVAAALASGLLLAAASTADSPVLANSMWEASGSVAASFVIKGGGVLKSTGAFEECPCDLWSDGEAGQVFVGMNEITFPGFPEGEGTVVGHLIGDPGPFKPTSVRISVERPETQPPLAQTAAVIYALLSGHEADIGGGASLRAGKLDPAKLGDILIDVESVALSGKFAGVKGMTELKGTANVKFAASMTSGPLSGKAVKGKLLIKVQGLPSPHPGMEAR